MNEKAKEVQPVTPAPETSPSDKSVARIPQTAAQVFDLYANSDLTPAQQEWHRRLDAAMRLTV